MSSDTNNASPSFFTRAGYAWNTVKQSGSISTFAGLTIFALVEKLFKLRDWSEKIGLDANKAYMVFITVWAVAALLAVRVVFSIAATAGEQRDQNIQLKKETADALVAMQKSLEARNEVFACLHAVIHRTRDCLLADGAFQRLVSMSDKDLQTHLYQTIEGQLGMMEKAFRYITGSDCHVVLKLVDELACDGAGGLVSCCYSPSTPIDRRSSGTILPLNQGIAQETVITKQICYTNDVLEDARFWPQKTKIDFAENRYRTVVACPVVTNGVVLGVLCFDWKKPNMYDKSQNEIYACFTDIVSSACYISYETRSVNQKSVDQTKQTKEVIKNA